MITKENYEHGYIRLFKVGKIVKKKLAPTSPITNYLFD